MTTDNAKLLKIKKNLKETSTYFRRKKEDVLNYLIEKSNTPTEKLPKELHIRRFEQNTTFLNEFLEELGYSVLYEEKHNAGVGFYYVVSLT